MAKKYFSHILLSQNPELSSYRNPRFGGDSAKIRKPNRSSHGIYLRSKLSEVWNSTEKELAVYHATRKGFYLEFKAEGEFDLAINSLESRRSKNQETNIRLLNIRESDGEKFATVFVPIEKKDYFFQKIDQYINENTKSGKPKNERLIANITNISNALKINSFWQDSAELIPQENPSWCEIWLSSNDEKVKYNFDDILLRNNIINKEEYVEFPERSVKIVLVNNSNLVELIALSDDIAEIRKAKDTASFWTNSSNSDQVEWARDLLDRLSVDPEAKTSICILDTGINNGHPLLLPILSANDCLAVKQSWGVFDHDSHGTLMAGIAGYGDLINCLVSHEQIIMKHILESVKILPVNKNENTPPELWGAITSQAVSLSEINAPDRMRIHCMAVTSEDTRDRGRPSSWSGAIDQIASGAIEDDKPKRLFILSGGNVTDFNQISSYPGFQCLDSIHDPSQAWNALTVGAYTDLVTISDTQYAGFEPIAPCGGLSPFGTTSRLWNDQWPIKPEIVMEGGNAALSQEGFLETECPDLSLLSTHFRPQESLFNHFNMTSAATAKTAWFASKIQSSYPDYWPETIRGLIVHSAEWTETLKSQFLQDEISKRSRKMLLRTCGFGVPNLERALYSASNCLTMVIQKEIQPYSKFGSTIRTCDMHLFELPWPSSVLQELPHDIDLKMRVTLSYFIEPGPGEIGWKDKYKYPSYSLKFFLKSPTESKVEFAQRINRAERDEEYVSSTSESDHWYFGEQIRHKGSIHSDIWIGSPQELATSNVIAIVPGSGWWKERKYLNMWNQKARYSLIVTLLTPEENIDIYTPILTQIGIPIQIVS